MSAILKQKLIDIANGFTKYGLWKGGGSKLSELDDVTLTNLQSNDVLTYNGSVWANDDNLQKQINTLNSNLKYKIYRSWVDFGMDDIPTYTTEEIINQMPEFSILIKSIWRSAFPNMHFSDTSTSDRCLYIIIKSLEGYTMINHFEVDTGNMYICGYRDNWFSDWH